MNRVAMNVVALALLTATSPLLADQDVDETRSVDADAYITISNAFGEIEVRGWDRNEVHVGGTLGEDVEELVIEETGSGLSIEVRNPRNSRNIDDTDLTIRVPEGASVELESVSADMELSGVAGERLVIETVTGDGSINANSGTVEISTVSGEMVYRGSATDMTLETVSGDQSVEGISGDLVVNTVSGDITVLSSALSVGRFDTVSGELDIEAALSDSARITAASMSGDISLQLPESVAARFELSTFSGDIRSQLGEVSNDNIGKSAEFTTGDGGARVRLESFSGGIYIQTD